MRSRRHISFGLRPTIAGLIIIAACQGGTGETATSLPEQSVEEPPDRSNVGFVENLLAREEAGEWERGEGLVASLKLFAGEVEPAEVLRQPELITRDGTGIIAMAREYLEDGPDEEARAEISGLLDRLIFSTEELVP